MPGDKEQRAAWPEYSRYQLLPDASAPDLEKQLRAAQLAIVKMVTKLRLIGHKDLADELCAESGVSC